MATIADLKNKLADISKAIEMKAPDIAIIVAMSAKALAERNIKEKGFGKVYSTVQVPAWFFRGKELNGSGTSFLEKHGVNPDGTNGEGKKKRRKKGQKEDPGYFDTTTTWGEFREAQGLQDKFVDLSYSNKMWADMAVVELKEEQGKVTAYLGARNREAQDKMNYNRDRYQDFINEGIGKDNQKLIAQVGVDEVIKVIEQF